MPSEEIRNHHRWMKYALKVAEDALKVKEVPVGCIYVHNNEIIAKGFNQTNLTLNGTRHAEFEGFDEIREKYPDNYDMILKETDLYVTVEPCIMCASLLRQIGIRRVFFGCGNERFGGNGSVFKVHCDYPVGADHQRLKKPYTVYPGLLNKEAVVLLRKFYLLENEKSPVVKEKKGRRLEVSEFPVIKYSDYLTKNEFVELFGYRYEFIYDGDLSLEFDEEGNLINDVPGGELKKMKSAN